MMCRKRGASACMGRCAQLLMEKPLRLRPAPSNGYPQMLPSGVKNFFVDRAFELRSFKYTTDVPLRETDL